MSRAAHIRIYEHQSLRVGDVVDDTTFSREHNQALERYFGNGVPYFSLIRDGVKFNEHVGVLQAGNLTIEVLPKADYEGGDDDEGVQKQRWQMFLINMLRSAGIFPEATSTASLKLKSNSILELYMQLFLQEVRYLMQTGLVRRYRKHEGNSTALKGSLQFAQNIRYNTTHAERFYVRHTVYDRNNVFNAILLQCLELITGISNNPVTISAAAALLLDFPECSDVKISEALFSKISLDRKTALYQKAIGIAKLLLLRFHPDVRQGSSDVLALMFDMNALWEKYVFRMLRKSLNPDEYRVQEQVHNDFWEHENGSMRIVKPDIVVYDKTGIEECAVIVLDTKWKRLNDARADDADLKQMLVYNLYNDCQASALLYPATAASSDFGGTFCYRGSHCKAIFLALKDDTSHGIRLDLSLLAEWIKQCAAAALVKRKSQTCNDN